MKKQLSIILAGAVFAMSGSALADFKDTENHWANGAINAWSSYGVISGYDGNFAPDRQITRGEFAVVLNRLMKYGTQAENSFADLDNNFYTESILKLNAKGVMSGYAGNVTPNGQLTREEAAVMLCRALEINGEKSSDRTFTDSSEISAWAREYVNAMVNRGMLNGYNGKLNPKNTITRAEVVTILNNAVYPVLSSGSLDGQTLDKILVISAPDVTVTNCVTNGNIIITEGADSGNVTFTNTKINGYLKINNDRTSFVKLENSTVAYGDVLEDDAIVAESSATVDDSNATGGKPQTTVPGGGSSSGGGGSSSGGNGGSGTGGGSTGGDNSGSGSGGGSTGGDNSGSGSGGGSTGGDNSGSGSGSGSTGGDNSGSGSGGGSTGGDNSGSGTGGGSTGGDNSGSGTGGGSTGGDNSGSGTGGSTGGDNSGSGTGGGSTGGDNSGSGTGSGSTGGDNSGSGTGSGSTGGDNSGSGTGGGSTGGDNSGSGTGGGSTGGDNSGSGSGGGSTGGTDEEDIDYAEVNAEMIENIEYALEDMEQLNIDDPFDGTLTPQEKKLMKIVRDCMKDSLKYENTNVINSAFIRKTYRTEIDKAVEIYDDMEAKGLTGEFHGKLAVLDTTTINWLLNEFGLIDRM